MILDEDKYKQDRSPYERPNFPYRCGRAVLWGKPCRHGPNNDGTCGGVSECKPFFDNGRWQCRRTGGACADGPGPNGQCSQRQLPCQPARTIRGIRARITLALSAVVIAVLAGFSFGLEDGGSFVVDPGPLSGIHRNFTAETGCKACHSGHGEDAATVLKALFTNNSPAERCVDCHGFNGLPNVAHNSFPTARFPHSQSTQCVMCHTEHKGIDANLTTITENQCAACHKVKFTSFTKGHPEFSETFPSRQRAKIAFSHANHFDKHFEDARYSARAPKERCVSCHDAAKAESIVSVKSYAQMCSACHDDAIASRPFVLTGLPELVDDPFAEKDETEKEETAKEGEEKAEAEPEEEFESISTESLTSITAYLLKVEADDPDEYGEQAGQLLRDMNENGIDALAKIIKDAGGTPKTMLHGLPAELTAGVMAAWSQNEEYEPPENESQSGWFATELTIGYKPSGHGDRVIKEWLDFAALYGNEAMQEELMSQSEGPGACTKCHAVNEVGASGNDQTAYEIQWAATDRTNDPFFSYPHKPHLILLQEGAYCETCHKVNQEADVTAQFKQFDPSMFTSSFSPIRKETCAECHGQGSVTATCTQCHNYHDGPVIRNSARAKVTDRSVPGREIAR